MKPLAGVLFTLITNAACILLIEPGGEAVDTASLNNDTTVRPDTNTVDSADTNSSPSALTLGQQTTLFVDEQFLLELEILNINMSFSSYRFFLDGTEIDPDPQRTGSTLSILLTFPYPCKLWGTNQTYTLSVGPSEDDLTEFNLTVNNGLTPKLGISSSLAYDPSATAYPISGEAIHVAGTIDATDDYGVFILTPDDSSKWTVWFDSALAAQPTINLSPSWQLAGHNGSNVFVPLLFTVRKTESVTFTAYTSPTRLFVTIPRPNDTLNQEIEWHWCAEPI